MIRRRITIKGRVQGVGFRYGAMHQANAHNLSGYSRNLSDGTVEIEVQGNLYDVEAFTIWCSDGPPRARIDSLETEDIPLTSSKLFKIK